MFTRCIGLIIAALAAVSGRVPYNDQLTAVIITDHSSTELKPEMMNFQEEIFMEASRPFMKPTHVINNIPQNNINKFRPPNIFDPGFKGLFQPITSGLDEPATFFHQSNKGHLVQPFHYYRVSNNHVQGITPYVSFFPVNSNGEINQVIRVDFSTTFP